ncbi:MAG: filamentous hemagglutinin N-terminal domain-containing protein [Pseudomonadota bacterium]
MKCIELLKTRVLSFGFELIGTLFAILFIILIPAVVKAEVVTDGTTGPATALSGPAYRIGDDIGSRAGNNLFHSFERFSLLEQESATFTGPNDIANVISRVTGGSVSTIDGLLRSEVGTADFYFINPAGVVFGPHAQVDVPAAFHVSTAYELRFADGSVFSATNPAASTLSAEAPESFGYLGTRVASLVVNGSKLEFAPESSVSLSGGNASVQGDAAGAARISVPGGELRISAVGNKAGAVPLTGELHPGAGSLQVTQAVIETSGDGGGELRVGAGSATLTNATLAADNTGSTDAAGGLDIAVAGALEVNASRIQSNAFGSGAAGGVRVQATDLSISQQGADTLTGLFSEVEPGAIGNSGGVDVNLDGTLTMRGAVGIDASSYGGGSAGDVTVRANMVDMDGEGAVVSYRNSDFYCGIESEVGKESSGKGGNVTVDVANRFSLINNACISSATNGAGDAGGVKIESGSLLIDGKETEAGITSQANELRRQNPVVFYNISL